MSESPRQNVAQNLADTCIFGGLSNSYGVQVQKSEEKGKTFWGITFCKARLLDGVIRVYSPNFIMIRWQGRTTSELPSRGQEVFRSELAAKQFLIKNFVVV